MNRLRLTSNLVLFILSTLAPNAFANNIGTDFQNFNPTTGVDKYFSVSSAETLKFGQFNIGLFIDGAMNTLPEAASDRESDSARRTGYQDLVTSTVLNIGWGILDRWELGFSLPYVISTDSEESGKISFEVDGVTEYRVNTKLRLFGDDDNGLALIITASLNQIENNPYMGNEDSLSSMDAVNYIGELAAGFKFGDSFDMAVNGGYRSRNAGTTLYPAFPADPVGDQITGSLALGWQASEKFRVITEVFGAYTVDEFRSDLYAAQNPAELVIGARYQASPNLYWYAGVGTEVLHATGTPDFRGFAGVNFAPRLYGSEEPKELPPTPEPVLEDGGVVGGEPSTPEPEPEPVVPEPVEKIVADNIYFESGSANRVLKSSMVEIEKLAGELKAKSFSRIVIAGYTDSKGNDGANMILSQKRAEAMKRILVNKHGLDGSKITTEGHGEENPIADNETPEGRQKNRRVEFSIFMDDRSPNPSKSTDADAQQPEEDSTSMDENEGEENQPEATEDLEE